MEKASPILVTGVARSGTTFTGKILALNKNIAYIHEPFNKTAGLEIIDVWYKYLTDDNITPEYHNVINDLIHLNRVKYKRKALLGDKGIDFEKGITKQVLSKLTFDNLLKGLARIFFKSRHQLRYFKNQLTSHSIERVLIKDPIAALASQFLHRHFGMKVVVILRHPLNIAASLKRVKWNFDFHNFLNQPDLMKDFLEQYRQPIEELVGRQGTFVQQSTLIWAIIYSVLFNFIENNPAFIIVKHEDICAQPIDAFTELYAKLDIPFTKKVQKGIIKYTSNKNRANFRDKEAHHLKRDSANLVKSWKNWLDNDEVEYIKNKTYKLASRYYHDKSWERE